MCESGAVVLSTTVASNTKRTNETDRQRALNGVLPMLLLSDVMPTHGTDNFGLLRGSAPVRVLITKRRKSRLRNRQIPHVW